MISAAKYAGTALVLVLVGATTMWSDEPGFDERVSGARGHMRSSCIAVRKAIKAQEGERDELRAGALGDARLAERAWRGIAKEFAHQIPDGYAGDPMWAARLHDIVLNLERMRTSIKESELRPAFLACAHACGLIGAMHEANGVRLPVDAMAALRKKVKVLKGLVTAGSPLADDVVPEILRLRDQVLLTPVPPGMNRGDYLQALPDLSAAVDEVATAARDGVSLVTPVQDLAARIELVYELAI